MDPQLFLVVMIAVEDTKSISFLTVEPFFLTGLTTVFLLFDHTPPSYFLFLSSNGEHKCWLLTFSSHCSCSSTSHLFTSRLRLVDWSTLKIANDLFTYFCILLRICYCFSHLIVLLSVTWLSRLYKFPRFFVYFLFLSDEGPMLETLNYTIRIGSTPTFLSFDLYLYSAYASHFVYFILWNNAPFQSTTPFK